MKTFNLEEIPVFKNFLKKDENNREINFYKLSDVISCGLSTYYPNVLFMSNNGQTYNPIRENIMSLKNLKYETPKSFIFKTANKKISCPVFYFIYNTDNYYHFIYDTLPYLISYFELKKEIPGLKLLMNYPNESKTNFYNFVKEFLNLLNIENEDILILDQETEYSEIYISSSFTHDIDSNLPPRKEIYEFYKQITEKVDSEVDTPKKIYISRRSWIHGDLSNMGTNYTSRRKLTNEDEVVEYLKSLGFVEIFTENLTTIDKIKLFKNCEVVVGSIGGGLCNVLFSPQNTKLISIISPHFLDINERFLHSFRNVQTTLFTDTNHVEDTFFKKYMRVKCDNLIGEITNVDGDYLEIISNKSPVAGWNSEANYEKTIVNCSKCFKLDEGLNSMFVVDIHKFKIFLEND